MGPGGTNLDGGRRRAIGDHGHSHAGAHAHGVGDHPDKRAPSLAPVRRNGGSPSCTRVVVVVLIMVLFMIPTVWLWQEAKKVQQAKQDSMREYIAAMSKIHSASGRRTGADEEGGDGDAAAAAAAAATLGINSTLELVHIRDGGDLYDRIIAPRSWDAPYAGGPNGEGLVWAVFFYKPYCGACRRIRPTVEALAATVDAWVHLRFAAVDCVKHSYFCTALDADDTPVIHLYKHDPAVGKRAVAATWRGLLVSYAVTNWLREQQTKPPSWPVVAAGSSATLPVLSPQIAWPDEEVLAQAMIDYKRRRQGSFNEALGFQSERVGARPVDPVAYLTDIKVCACVRACVRVCPCVCVSPACVSPRVPACVSLRVCPCVCVRAVRC
jgi:hypothetical protein